VRALLVHFCRGAPHGFLTNLAGLFPHLAERRIRRKLGNGSRKILVERIAALLLNLARFRRILVTVAAIQSGFFHASPPPYLWPGGIGIEAVLARNSQEEL
jgi:hypothetical protein